MPTIVREFTFAAAGSNPNINAGSVFETARRRQALSMAVVTTVAANLAVINIGADVVAEEFVVGVLATYPVVPDHFVFTDIAEIGDRLVIQLRATIATVYRSIIIIADI